MESQGVGELAGLYAKAFGDDGKIQRALEMLSFALKENGEQEAYMRHNMAVAATMFGLGFDRNAVLAGLLHNAQRIGVPIEAVAKEFGRSVLELIEQQERFERALGYKAEDMESTRKKILAVLSASPVAVILQLAEALDKIRNIGEVPSGERVKFIEEVKELYAPLSHKLGIYPISSEMSELAFRMEQPEAYEKILAAIGETTRKADASIRRTREELEASLKAAGIDVAIHGRVKTVYSTYSKMKRKGVGINKVYDLVAIRLVVGTEKECYEALGIVHSLWKPIPGEFDDYIAKPKENGYRSLHTSVFVEDMTPVEIQIRTKEMHDFAEFGIASHWAYKGGKADTRHDKKIEWIKQLIEWEKGKEEKAEMDIFGKEVFAMTPKGEVIQLPFGATVLDFGYAVHSDLGDRCQGAKVNGIMVSLNTMIRNGDVVEVVTSAKQEPKAGWLGFVKTAKARQKIRARLKLNVPSEAGVKKMAPQVGRGMTTSDRKIRLAKCCLPVPGDEIIGFRTTKRKIAVHRSDCQQAKKMGGKVDVYWGGGTGEYEAEIIVEAVDRSGMLKDILGIFSGKKVRVKSTSAKSGAQNNITCTFGIAVKNLTQLDDVTRNIRGLKGITAVYRQQAT